MFERSTYWIHSLSMFDPSCPVKKRSSESFHSLKPFVNFKVINSCNCSWRNWLHNHSLSGRTYSKRSCLYDNAVTKLWNRKSESHLDMLCLDWMCLDKPCVLLLERSMFSFQNPDWFSHWLLFYLKVTLFQRFKMVKFGDTDPLLQHNDDDDDDDDDGNKQHLFDVISM